MASTVEKITQVAEQAVNDVTNALSNTSLTDNNKDENKDAVHASAAEGRRLYIGNLAYATTEGELKEFFKGYLV
jgi:RNA recognition motif-containing protein